MSCRAIRQLLGDSLLIGLLIFAPRAAIAHEPAQRAQATSEKLHEDTVLNEALIAWRRGDPDKAAVILRKAIEEKPDSFDYWAYLGRLQLQRGEDGPHILRYGLQVSARPLDSSIDTEAWRKEKLTEAFGCFQKLVELRQDYAVGYGYQVICLLGLERSEDAESAARQAVAQEPQDPIWRLQLAAVLRMNGKLDESSNVLDAVERLAPRSGSLHQERFRLAQSRNEPAERVEQLRLRAVFFTYLIPLATSRFSSKRAQITERFGGGRSGVKAPEDVEPSELLDLIARQAKRPDGFAADLWLSILHHDNHDAEVTDAAARALEQTGAETNDRLLWVLLNSPESSATQRRVARILAKRKDVRIFEPLVQFLPDDADLWPVEAATALGLLGDSRAVPHLASVARGEAAARTLPQKGQELGYEMNRRRCVEALRYFDTPESQETLEQLSSDPHMRSTALASVYFLTHDARKLEELAAMLEGRGADFRAVHDMALLDDEAAWRVLLERGPRSSNEQVRAHTARTIRYATPTETQRPEFIATLERLAAYKAKIVAQEAERGLDRLRDNNADEQ